MNERSCIRKVGKRVASRRVNCRQSNLFSVLTNRVNTRSKLRWLYYLCRYLQRKGEGSAVTIWGLNALVLAVLFWAVMYLLLLAILAFNYQKKMVLEHFC